MSITIGSHRTPQPQTTWQSASPSPLSDPRHVVYSPFAPINGVRKLGTSWESHSKYIVVRHGDSPKPLSIVKPDTVLYIVCHCSPSATTVADNAHNRMTADVLAQQMESDGLTHFIKKLKFYGCSGAVGGSNSFASGLLRELRDLGYDNVEMFGYVSTVTSLDASGHKWGYKTIITDDDNGNTLIYEEKVRASQVRIPIEI
jgi:hypothetical protein